MIHFHPSDDALARLAAGTLEAGPTIVVRTHVEGCPRCAAALGRFEAVGGTLLDAMEPVAMHADAFAMVEARLDRPAAAGKATRSARALPANGPIVLPAALDGLDIGPWRWLAPGVRRSRVTIPGAPGADLVMYRIGPNRQLPHHGHAGAEYTQVLSGSFFDETGHYHPGDLVEADGDVDHQPRVGPEGECICLAAVEGRMLPHGFFGRMLRPFV